MQSEELKNLVFEIQRTKSERQNIELKTAANGSPEKIFDTLSSFSNQDDGGTIIFGIDEKNDYSITGVYDAQDLQKKITEQCNQMEPVVRALFTLCEIDDKIIVSAEIPAVDLAERPVFYKGVGRIKGSYIRVGDADEHMSEYEIYSYEAFRKRTRNDLRAAEGSKASSLDKGMLSEYLAAVKKERKNFSANVSDNEILELMGVLTDGTPTVAGLLTFSMYPQTYFPQLCITAVSVPGTEMGVLGEEGERFLDNKRITGPISEMLDGAVDFVRRNSKVKTIIDENGRRQDKYEYPITAVREAILNALVHRDYSIHTENTPIRLEMYNDRLELTNSGGLYGKISIDLLGKVHPETRNSILANILELLKITENRYSGIPTMQAEMKKSGLPAPQFSVNHGEFKVVFKNSNAEHLCITDRSKYGEALLEFCKTPRSREELTNFFGKSRYYVMSSILQPMLDNGKVGMTIPEKPKSSLQRYYTI